MCIWYKSKIYWKREILVLSRDKIRNRYTDTKKILKQIYHILVVSSFLYENDQNRKKIEITNLDLINTNVEE